MSGMQLVDDDKKHVPFDLTPSNQSFRSRQSHLPTFHTPSTNPASSRRSHQKFLHRRSTSAVSAYAWRFRRLASRPSSWVIALLLMLTFWWSRGSAGDWQTPQFRKRLQSYLPNEITKDLQYFPASHRRIHYVGRWTAAPNRLRIDGAFPGVYFEVNVTNTTTIVVSLQNIPSAVDTFRDKETDVELEPADLLHVGGQHSFSAASMMRVAAPPVSLLALIDSDEYSVLPNATGLCSIRNKDLDRQKTHTVRIIAPMTDNGGIGVVQVDGIWLDKGGQLLPVEGSIADSLNDEIDEMEGDDEVGHEHRLGLHRILRGASPAKVAQMPHTGAQPDSLDDDSSAEFRKRKKLVEIITDDPANFRGRKQTAARSGGADGLLAGVMGWEYLLGEMFSVDHVCVGVEGQCLLQNCVGGAGAPAGLGDVFFRSGPVDSPHFGHLWPFQAYAPDVLILNLGASDFYSFTNKAAQYNYTGGELFRAFEDTYVTLIKSIRTMAYPNHPATIEMQRLGVDAYGENNAPAQIPIFIMRPFGGELEWASQGAVNRLRAEGDKGVFWLDTSGWLDFEGTETRSADVFRDRSVDPPRYHLTERGNQKVAIYLHMHVCRYLAGNDEKCPFLPPEVYHGQVFDASVATFENYIEQEKERQIHEVFWQQEGKGL